MSRIASPEGEYEAHQYWSSRLETDFSLAGVGYRALGERFNRWQYRAYIRNLERAERRFGFDLAGQSILECGFGTGFFLDYYHRRGNRQFAGVDLTEVAVSRLAARYPDADLRQADLGADTLEMGRTYDIVTAFAVLLHITDDDRFSRAMATICRHAERYVLISDVFPARHFAAPGKRHYVLRSRSAYEAELARHGFEVAGLVPIFFLLSTPRPTVKWWFYFWNAVLYLLCRTEITGHLFGALLYGLDGLLMSLSDSGPSTRLLVARRREA